MNDSINIYDSLLKSIKALSSVLATIFIIIIVLCTYIIQRSVIIFTDIPTLIYDGGEQVKLWAFVFSYRTLTILWPAILGTVCLSYYLLSTKRLYIVGLLRKKYTDLSVDLIVTMDPLLITAMSCGLAHLSYIFRFAAILPFVTLCCHISIIFVPLFGAFEIVKGHYFKYLMEFTFLMLFTIAAWIFGFWGVLLFKKALLETVYLNNKENLPEETIEKTTPHNN